MASANESLEVLADKITEMAEGVFLWVFLVTKMLLKGLTNDDSPANLYRRLVRLPSDLEVFFKHLLNSVDEFYHDQMAGLLRLAMTADRPLPLLLYSAHEKEYEDEQYALKEQVNPIQGDEYALSLKTATRRLNARCKGLLEARNGDVQFLHRTVLDFLKTGEMGFFLKKKSKPDFDPNLSLLRAYLAYVKHLLFPDPVIRCAVRSLGSYIHGPLVLSLLRILNYTRFCEYHPETSCLLDEVERSIGEMVKTGQAQLSNGIPTLRPDHHQSTTGSSEHELLFREHILRLDMHRYISKNLTCSPDYFACIGMPPLLYIVRLIRDTAYPTENTAGWSRRLETLQCLFSQGADPNEETLVEASLTTNRTSPWKELVSALMDVPKVFDIAIRSNYISLFLQQGADINARTMSDNDGFSRPFWLRFMLYAFESNRAVFVLGKQYLQLLRRTLQSGPEFFDVYGQAACILDDICRAVLKLDASDAPQHVRFLTMVLTELVNCPEGNEWAMENLLAVDEELEAVLGHDNVKAIFDTLHSTSFEQHDGHVATADSRKRKMGWDDYHPGEPPTPKFQRTFSQAKMAVVGDVSADMPCTPQIVPD